MTDGNSVASDYVKKAKILSDYLIIVHRIDTSFDRDFSATGNGWSEDSRAYGSSTSGEYKR